METSEPLRASDDEVATAAEQTAQAATPAVPEELFWKLPATPVSLPREGPPAMSPRARRRARELRVPLQVLPIPAAGKRITERDVLAAAEALKARQAEVTEPVRYPAVREPLSTAELERARAWSYSQHCIPQLSVEALLPCAGILAGLKKLAAESSSVGVDVPDLMLRAVTQALCDEKFRAFRAVIDGTDRVLRGSIDLGFSTPEWPADARVVVKAADRMDLAALVHSRKSTTPSSTGTALVTLAYYGGTGIISGNERVWPGDSAVLAVYDAQPQPILRPGRGLEIQTAWKVVFTVDQRVIDRTLATDFLKFLMRRMDQVHCLL